MHWSIPRPVGDALAVDLQAGQQIYVVGANGSGKSALLQHLATSADGKIRRIFAHRQTWLNSGGLTFTPHRRLRFERERLNYDMSQDSLWRDHTGSQSHEAVLFDLVAAENKRARSITQLVENRNIKCAQKAAEAASPFARLNDLLALGTLRVSLHNADNAEIVARIGDGPSFGIEKMSDGERNAAIIAATVLTVEPDTTLLVDEPERHLHRSIIAPFLAALFDQRQDCAFVISTHELFLPLENADACVLMTRSCTWAGDRPQAWDLRILEPLAQLPEALRLAVLGARARVLFVEGTASSLDLPLYTALFPNVSVSPHGNCLDVERAVAGLRATVAHHHVEAFGLIDRDGRGADEIAKLVAGGVFALDVRSVEALYYCSDAIEAVARHQADALGLDAGDLVDAAKREALRALGLDEDIERMAARRCEGRMREAVFAQIPDWKAIREAASPTELSVESTYAQELAGFRRLLAESDFDALVARYPLRETRAFDCVATALQCKSTDNYERMVVVQATKDTALAGAMKQRICPLAAELDAGSSPEP